MALFTIPTETVEKEPQNFDAFPEGIWEGTIEVCRVREIFDGDGGDFFLKDKEGSNFAEKCEVGSLQIGSNTAVLEGQPDIGEMKFFLENLILSFDELNWDAFHNVEGDKRWQLGSTQLRLTKLAHALGLTEEEDGGVGPVENFDELLRTTNNVDPDTGIPAASGLNGLKVRFKVYHRKFTRRDGTPGKQAMVAQFYPVE